MRPQKITLSLFLMGLLLSAVVAFSAVMCLNDAFSLGADLRVLLLCAVLFAVLSTALMFPKGLWPSLAVAVAAAAAVFWLRAPFLKSLSGIAYVLSEQFSRCYEGLRVVGEAGGDPVWVLALLTLPLAWVTAWVVCREGSVAAVFLACAPILLVCLVIVDLAPVFYLVLLTGALLLLLMTHSVRADSSQEAGRLSWWLLLPTVILVAAITVLWPPADYVRADWSDALQTLAEAKVSLQRLGTTILYRGPAWNSSLKTVDLSAVGPRANTGRAVLTYEASTEIDYLRGVSLGIYEDNTWSAIPQSEYTAQTFDLQPQLALGRNGGAAQTLHVTTYASHPVLYTAYGLNTLPDFASAVDDAYLSNPDRLTDYQLRYTTDYAAIGDDLAAYDRYVYDHYLQIPEALQEPLQEIIDNAGLSAVSAQEAAAMWVRELGTYDLDTPAVPAGEDFVLYFLTQSQRGYCVHFASATVLLMRALGIPARYVTGYAVSGAAGETQLVTEDSAHAWVEYYVSGKGWLPVDPTPPDALSHEEETVTEPEPEEPDEPDVPDTPAPETPDTPDTPEEPETPDTPSVPTQEGTSGEAASKPADLRWLWILTLPGAVGLVWLRRVLALRGRLERCRKGHPNRRALTLWRWLRHLSKADGIPLDEDLLALAEKARFSQHTITDEELQVLEDARDRRIAALRSQPMKKRLWQRYGQVLY